MLRVVRTGRVISCFLALYLADQSPAQSSGDELTVYAGAVIFNNPAYDSLVLVDFPLTLNRQQFEFFRADSADPYFYGRIFAQVSLFDAGGMQVDSNSTYFSVRVSSPQEAANTEFTLFNRLSLLATPGVYSARVTVIDAVSKRAGGFFLDRVIVEPSRRERLTIGGMCLAYQITYVGEDAGGDRMVFNGFQVLANPLRVFSYKDTALYLYAELYNLSFPEPVNSRYRLAYIVFDDTGAVYRDFGYKLRETPGSTAVVTEVFDIAGWPPGQYRLRMIATDLAIPDSDTVALGLTIVPELRPSLATGEPQVADPYSELSLEEKEHLAVYLLTPDQKLTLSRLSPKGKDNFLEQFWRENDGNPETKVIENRLEMMERYNFCNRHFSYSEQQTNGWSTDRGRIYMTYGPWEEREDISAPATTTAPFIIWFYRSLREGTAFVFEDKHRCGDYTLVHSNMEGERFSKEWEDRLRQELYDMY